MNIDVFYVAIIVNWTLSVDAFLNFLIFPKISALSQKLALVQNQLEKLGKVYMNNFHIGMYDLKLRIKAGTSKNRYNIISERSFFFFFFFLSIPKKKGFIDNSFNFGMKVALSTHDSSKFDFDMSINICH